MTDEEKIATVEMWLRTRSKCSRCNAPFTGARTLYFGPGGDGYMFFMFCQDCSDSFKAHGFFNNHKLTWVEIPTERK
jgi:hypothetical protein